MLDIHSLSHTYGQSSAATHRGGRQALNDINLSLGDGLHMLLGPNGAGKSTLFALLTRLLPVQSGYVHLLGEPPNRQTMAKLGVVFQQSTLDLDLTVAQNLNYYGALHGFSATQTQQHAAPLLAHFSLSNRLNDKVRTLNGGHRRRTELVRALMHSPSILLLDEPTSGLDPKARASLSDAVRSLCEQKPLCVLWATHLIEEVTPTDDVLVLNKGQLKAHDSARNLVAFYQVESLSEVFSQLTDEDVQ
ncbi:ABC transporter ATP-binding protein [Enterovibrio norvegicus]|uniref:ATP-binding cassette domain-containing protein n=1 Tax=Enterovibrio norvegicus TaxID=188144 RepID=UPI000C81B47A|nr:ATP-binding cassette domain-containing protein [Enterovibrio norvegicus]MCC4799181.1 ATP-binding cassette domain-containing protein [Enterovibrio norvegicus]PMI34300.1 ABC transporter ATP-binding protein [Enterovibrio norvegicus]PMI34995.1 ABC transporter ATP-binding protein [Enterovibrio norvegicus]PMN53736.1 ABC transporter ATP-binding protein [Enterovibrio norvegicus]TKF13240.1 ATP-binding cassette domain-containing protein [Enterovibrio norvegicus]